jgi:tol-pal system protein YbgF
MARLSRWIPVALWLCVGCAHQPASEPSDPTEPAVARLRRDNAAMRRRVQMLEDRVLKLEKDEMAVSVGPQDRDLPVYRLEPSEPSAPRMSRRPAPSEPAMVAERSPAPSRSRQLGRMPTPQVEEEWTDPSGFNNDTVADAPVSSQPAASYRLVGSHLVEMTQREPPAPKKPQRRKAKGIKAQYHQAMDLLKAGQNVEAEAAFAEFAVAHPDHDYADNALYWKGEAAYDQAHYSDALAAFTEVVERYAGGNKAPDALLKIGLCYGNLGDVRNAKDVLTQLVSAYPSARASDIARARLAEYGL